MSRKGDSESGFMGLSGEMARRIAAHDWASTTLGPVERWPVSLRNTVSLMLLSPAPMLLLWGSAGVMLYNDAYARLAGARASRLLGLNVRDGWSENADYSDTIMQTVLAGEVLSSRDQELTLYRNGSPEKVWMDLDYSPVLGDDGKPAGVLAIIAETTKTHLDRETLRQSEKRLRFLDSLAHAVADCRDADQVLDITTRMTAKHLHVPKCAYADMDDGNRFTMRGGWAEEGLAAILGHYHLSDFGEYTERQLHAGKALVIRDNAAQLPEKDAAVFQSGGIAATICIPLVKDGVLTAMMAVHDDKPHDWTDDDISTIREVAERSWAHVQRVGAESTLRDRDAYNRQILDGATDYGIVASDLDGKVTLWNAGAAAMLGWTEAEMLGQSIDIVFDDEDRAAGRPGAARREALEHGRSQEARWQRTKAGDRLWASTEITPLHDDHGTVIGFVHVMRDRTSEHKAETALRLSEDQLRRAQVAGGVGLFSIDIASNTIRGTDEFCRLFGVEQHGAVSPEIFEQIVVPEDRDKISNLVRRYGAATALDVEYAIRRADTGEKRIIARKADFEFDDSGRAVRMVGVVQDITDRRRTQRALEKSEGRFSVLAQAMPAHVWTTRADGRFDWANDRVCAYVGQPREVLQQDGWIRYIHPADRDVAERRWATSLATGDVFDCEMRLLDAQGRYRWHLSRALPMHDASGAISGWVGTNTEIEAQKRAEAAYAQDRDRLWNISRDLMLVCDFNGAITAVNPSAERLLGWHEGEMIGRRIGTFVHPDDRKSTAAEVARLSTGTRTVAFENRYRTKDGSYRLLAWTAVPDDGRIHAVGRDITDQRSVEDALRQSQKMEAVGQLTGGIAHDFNNLLQGITGSLDILHKRLAQGRTQDLDKWVQGARSSAERAAALTHRLLAFSRRQPLDPRPVRVNPLLSSIEDMLRRTLGEHIEVELSLAEDLWLTRCDANQLESAILNLAINARDAMPDGGRLTVATRNAHPGMDDLPMPHGMKAGDYVCIAITDTGEGMKPETLSRAFEPFFTTKPIGQGTGLGLSMIYGFVRQSEGYTQIESAVGVGTTVTLYLPRHVGMDSEAPASEREDAPPLAQEGEVVLVVEDEPVVRHLIMTTLDELGYSALEADDGPSGLAILQSDSRIDLLITDIGLPGLNGRQVADGGRALRPDLKVLFMTGYAENAAAASGFLEAGMALITKPFAIDALASRIRDILEGRNALPTG